MSYEYSSTSSTSPLNHSSSNNTEMEEIHLNLSGSGSPPVNQTSGGNEFLNQMEQVFKAIDQENTGIITLAQLRQEIEALGDIEENPMISKLYNYLRIVHSNPRGGSLALNMSMDTELEDDSEVQIDFNSFIQTMANFSEDMDPMEARKQRLERLKLPKFKVPIDLLKKYNITPRLSPLQMGQTSGSSVSSTPGKSPTKNKFNRLFHTKPVIEFDQFNDLVTKLNYGKEIPKSKLLLFLSDLPKDQDECVDAQQFLSRYAGLNHPLSPKLTFDSSATNTSSTGFDEQFELASNSPGSIYGINKNSQILEQMADLENENQNFLSEIQNLEKYKQQIESQLKKKETEIEKLKRESRFVDGMRDSNKDLTVQNNNLKSQIQKLSSTEEMLKSTIEQERERARSLNETNILKELEIKKLQLLLKTQQNINNKLSMMVTFSNEVGNNNSSGGNNDDSNQFKDKTFTLRRIKPAVDKARQILTKQKSDLFSDTLKSYQSPGFTSPLTNESISGTTSPINENPPSLESEFQELQEQNQDEFNQLKNQLNISNISLPNENDDPVISSSTSNNNLSQILSSSSPNIGTIINNNSNNTTDSPLISSSPSNSTTATQNPLIITPTLGGGQSPYNSISKMKGPTPIISGTGSINAQSPIASLLGTPNQATNGLSPLALNSSSGNYGSIKKLKKSELVLLHTNELKEHNENAEILMNQMKEHLENNNQQIEKLNQQLIFEKYNNKLLEDQIRYERDLALTENKQNTHTFWGFFSLVYNILPTSLFCNASNTP